MRRRLIVLFTLALGLAALMPLGAAVAQPAAFERVGASGASATELSVAVSEATFDRAGGEDELGAEAVSSVFAVLGREDLLADAAASGPLLGGAPLLAVPGGADGELPGAVGAELTRALPPGSTVYLAGGTEAVSTDIESATAGLGFIPTRLPGADRTATSVAIAEEAVRLYGAPEEILLVGADDDTSAVAAGAFAADQSIPLLLTPAGALAEPAAAFLAEHPDAEVTVVGAEAAVSEGASRAAGADRRVAGSSPAETAALLSERWPDDVTGAALVSPSSAEGLRAGLAGGTVLQPVLYCGVSDGDEDANQATVAALEGRDPILALGGTDLLPDAAIEGCLPVDEPGVDEPGVDGPGAPGARRVTRVAGSGRTQTALEASRAAFGDGEAGAVVLTRPDEFPDALAGTPLAVAEDAPLLLTATEGLEDEVATEIRRVLPPGGTVFLLGGTAALSDQVRADVEALGYTTTRYGGANRNATAAVISEEGLGAPDLVLAADGANFPDAVAAGAAAGANDGAVLLTGGETVPPETQAYLDRQSPSTLFAAGGPAARALPDATPLVGADRIATAVAVAEELFDAPTVAGVATAGAFPDALSGGALVGRRGGPMLLSFNDELSPEVGAYLEGQPQIAEVFVFGGVEALTDEVEQALRTLLGVQP